MKMSDLSRQVYGLDPSEPETYMGLDLDAIRDRWNRKASRWDADLANPLFHLNEDDAYGRFLQTVGAIVSERRDFCRGHGLIDLGCGTGAVLSHLAHRFAWAVGVDISDRMLELAQRRGLPGVSYLCHNCFNIGDLIGRAGAVVSRGILLSHYGEALAIRLLEQVRQLLEGTNGFAVLDYLNEDGRHLHSAYPSNKRAFTADEMRRLATAAGFGRVTALGEPERRNRLVLLEAK
jgi:SAM-dependent methyltransferase